MGKNPLKPSGNRIEKPFSRVNDFGLHCFFSGNTIENFRTTHQRRRKRITASELDKKKIGNKIENINKKRVERECIPKQITGERENISHLYYKRRVCDTTSPNNYTRFSLYIYIEVRKIENN